MEDYRLDQSGQEVQGILNGAAMQTDLTEETERAELAEQTLDGKIDDEETRAKAAEKQNADDIDAIEEKIPSGASSANKLATQSDVSDEESARQQADQALQGNIDAEELRAKAAEKQNADDIDAIEEKIPSGASSSDKLATESYVNDKVATDSATFRGTFNLVSDLGLVPSATHSQIAAALLTAIATADNNDYAFVQVPTFVETPTQIAKIERYKFDGSAWAFEYDLNNSGFTASQWAAINSGITSGDVSKLAALPTNSELTTLLNGKQDALTFDNVPTQASNNPVKSGGVYSAIDEEKGARRNSDEALEQSIAGIAAKIPDSASSSNKMATESEITTLSAAIEAILALIPSAATALNQLADKAFVNSSIATASAVFRGTFNLVSDLHLALDATHAQIGAALLNAVPTADNNDYAFVQVPTSAGTPTEIRVTERYKFNGESWSYEYDLNNSGFTASQWEAINSAITSALVAKLSALPTASELTTLFAGKQNVLTFDNAPVNGSNNPVKSGGLYDLFAAIDAKFPSDASSSNKLVAENRLASYVAGIIGVIDASFDLTSADGHVTFKMTQANGAITSVQILTSDIASAQALTTLGGQVSTNASDIAALQDLYNALQQSAPEIIQPTDTWPVANPSDTVIYRVIDRENTPPEYYSDYMFKASDLTTPVLMATYNNAIDPRPKKGSANLVTSGGVFDNMGALDVSELNATEGPHTLATYATLDAAIAAIPSDYQKGGMSIKFVQTSDNKYVQYRLMLSEFTAAQFTNTDNWQGVDDEPTPGSQNLVNSGGVIKSVVKNQGLYSIQGFYYRATTGALASLSGCYSTPRIPIGNKVELYTYLGKSSFAAYGIVFFDKDNNFISGYNAATAGTDQGMQKVVLTENEIPSNAAYMTAMLPDGNNLDKVYIFRDNELLQLNINNYLEYKTYKESSAAIQFVSGLANIPHLPGFLSGTQIREGAEEYIVIRVNGGDAIEIGTGISGSKIVILADFDVPTKYPYDLIFATGETTSRNIESGYSATLPSDAKYLLLRSNDATRNFIPQTFKINGYELCSDITEKIIPLTTQVEGLENTLNIETETEAKTSYYNNTCDYIVGAITENGGGINTSYTNYRSYYFYAPEDGSISIDVGSATWFRMNTGVGTPESLTVKHYGNYGDVGKPLPTAQNPWLVSKGDVIVFCAYYNVTDFVLTYSYDLVSYVITGATVKMPPKGLLVWNGTYFEFFSKRNDKQYVSFLVKHYKNDSDTVYQDVWSCRESKLYDYIDNSVVFNKDLMNAQGESEFTMLVSGKADHTGGYHGDERLDGDSKCYVKFFVDGREITAADMEDEFSIECNEFSYVEYTTLHETSATSGEYVAGHPIIAYHLKKVTFKDCKNNVENYIKFTTQQSLSRFYSSIACVSKNTATKAVMDGNVDEYNGNTLVASHGTLVQLVGTRHYFRCENPTSKNLIMFNTDNNLKVNLYATMLQGISDADMTISQIWDRDGGDNDSKWYRNNGSTVTIQSGTIVANHQIIEFL